jgi:Leucine-rich repeat (LRR) protein
MIQLIRSNTFSDLENLSWLLLFNNQIEKIEENALIDIVLLKKLDLSENKLKSITVSLFRELKNLEELKIYKNSIELVDKRTFNGLVSLKLLMISGNSLKSIPTTTFSNLKNLERLELDELLNKSELYSGLNSLKEVYKMSSRILVDR